MAAYGPGTDPVARDLLCALGFEPKETRKVVLVIEPDALVTAYVVLAPNAGDLKRVTEIIKVHRVQSVEVTDQAEVKTG